MGGLPFIVSILAKWKCNARLSVSQCIFICRYLERNTTLFPLPEGRSLLIFEPCNTASNFAYYHMVTSLARRRRWVMGRANTRALAQTCSALALGSASCLGSESVFDSWFLFDSNDTHSVSFLREFL